jgi:hypothetical protein
MSKIEDAMAKQQSKSQPGWADVKANLADFDRAALLGLVQDLYIAHKNNQAFLHARFGLGEDVLGPYKTIIDRWLWPDVLRRQDTSVSKAKQAIADYKKALGDAEGVAELMVFYCERAAGFSLGLSHDDAGYFDALVRMFAQALRMVGALPANVQDALIVRPESVRDISLACLRQSTSGSPINTSGYRTRERTMPRARSRPWAQLAQSRTPVPILLHATRVLERNKIAQALHQSVIAIPPK